MESALLAEPAGTKTKTMPDHGPPVRIRGCIPSDQPMKGLVPVSSKENSPAALTPRRTPPREYAPANMHEAPPPTPKSPKQGSAGSPTPLRLSLPEFERPASRTMSPTRNINTEAQSQEKRIAPVIPATKASSVGITAFHGFDHPPVPRQFRPPKNSATCGSNQPAPATAEIVREAPYAQPSEPAITLSQAEPLIDAKMTQYEAPPPPPPIRPRPNIPQERYHPYRTLPFAQPYQYQISHEYAPASLRAAQYRPPMPLSSDALPAQALSPGDVAADIETICSKIGLPPSSTFGQYLKRVRDFDKHNGLGDGAPGRPHPPRSCGSGQAKPPETTTARTNLSATCSDGKHTTRAEEGR